MHSAPAVSYPVGRSHFHAVLLIGVLTVGAGSLIAWIAQSDAVSLRHVTMADQRVDVLASLVSLVCGRAHLGRTALDLGMRR